MKSKRPELNRCALKRVHLLFSTGLRLGRLLSAIALLPGSSAVVAQEGGAGRVFSVQPRFDLASTLSSDLHSVAGVKDAGLMLQASPGVRITSSAGRVRGYLDYALSAVGYAKSSAKEGLQNSLNAAVSVEAIDRWLFVDLTAGISQQAISAFGVQSPVDTLNTTNRAEVWSFMAVPRVRGVVAGVASYEIAATVGATNTRRSSIGDSTTQGAQLSLGGANAGVPLNWSLNASTQSVDFREGRRTQDKRLTGSIIWRRDAELQMFVNAGIESNTLASDDSAGQHGTAGAGLVWTPSERTKLSLQKQSRFFGDSHTVSFEHRMPRSVWRFSDSKDVTTNNGQGRAGSGSNYDQYYRLFASQVPDPVQRDIFVRNYLQAQGINPNAVPVGGFLSSAPSVTRRQELSFALSGVRDTVTLMATRSNSRRLDALAPVGGDFSTSGTVRQTGFIASLSHRLTPNSSASVSLSQQRTEGDLSTQTSTLRSILANWSSTLGAKTTMALGVRHIEYRAVLNSYTEDALYANLSRRF